MNQENNRPQALADWDFVAQPIEKQNTPLPPQLTKSIPESKKIRPDNFSLYYKILTLLHQKFAHKETSLNIVKQSLSVEGNLFCFYTGASKYLFLKPMELMRATKHDSHRFYQHVEIKLERDEKVQSLCLNKNGTALFLLANSSAYVAAVPNFSPFQSKDDKSAKANKIIPPNPFARALEIKWHPMSATHILVLWDDNTVRLYDAWAKDEENAEECVYHLDTDDDYVVSFDIANIEYGGDSWTNMTMYAVTASNSIYAYCPVLPKHCKIDSSLLEDLGNIVGNDPDVKGWINTMKRQLVDHPNAAVKTSEGIFQPQRVRKQGPFDDSDLEACLGHTGEKINPLIGFPVELCCLNTFPPALVIGYDNGTVSCSAVVPYQPQPLWRKPIQIPNLRLVTENLSLTNVDSNNLQYGLLYDKHAKDGVVLLERILKVLKDQNLSEIDIEHVKEHFTSKSDIKQDAFKIKKNDFIRAMQLRPEQKHGLRIVPDKFTPNKVYIQQPHVVDSVTFTSLKVWESFYTTDSGLPNSFPPLSKKCIFKAIYNEHSQKLDFITGFIQIANTPLSNAPPILMAMTYSTEFGLIPCSEAANDFVYCFLHNNAEGNDASEFKTGLFYLNQNNKAITNYATAIDERKKQSEEDKSHKRYDAKIENLKTFAINLHHNELDLDRKLTGIQMKIPERTISENEVMDISKKVDYLQLELDALKAKILLEEQLNKPKPSLNSLDEIISDNQKAINENLKLLSSLRDTMGF